MGQVLVVLVGVVVVMIQVLCLEGHRLSWVDFQHQHGHLDRIRAQDKVIMVVKDVLVMQEVVAVQVQMVLLVHQWELVAGVMD
jgi:hypothetical protein